MYIASYPFQQYRIYLPCVTKIMNTKFSFTKYILLVTVLGLPQWLSDKESTCNAGDMGLIPGLGRSPRRGLGNQLQYSCHENPMDRVAWRAIIHRVTKSQT